MDADACPVKQEILQAAKRYKIPVIMFIDTSHELHDGYSQVVTVDKGRDSVDLRLINRVKAGDLVVTQDYGLAALVLAKGARALNQNGFFYDEKNIDRLLFERHLGQKSRRAGVQTAHIKKRSAADNQAFSYALNEFLQKEKGAAE